MYMHLKYNETLLQVARKFGRKRENWPGQYRAVVLHLTGKHRTWLQIPADQGVFFLISLRFVPHYNKAQGWMVQIAKQ